MSAPGGAAGDADPDRTDECLSLPREFSQDALDKCSLYGVNPELVREGSRFRVFECLPENESCFSTVDTAESAVEHAPSSPPRYP
jgi:hypothetical protein